MFVGKGFYANVFKKNDNRTIYNVVNVMENGPNYIKRFSVTGVTRNKDYDLTKGNPLTYPYFSANPNSRDGVISNPSPVSGSAV